MAQDMPNVGNHNMSESACIERAQHHQEHEAIRAQIDIITQTLTAQNLITDALREQIIMLQKMSETLQEELKKCLKQLF